MKYVNLGTTGVQVSELCLGTISLTASTLSCRSMKACTPSISLYNKARCGTLG
jgi:aryl-alcohol dehydrogenase-like predicted oxidoreductase